MTTRHTGGAVPGFTIGDRLRKAREHAGMSQIELATAVGIARQTVSRSELGDTTPHRLVVRGWAAVTGVSLQWLETGEVSPMGGDTSPGGEHPALWSAWAS